MVVQTSVSNYLSLLNEEQPEIKSYALEKIDGEVDQFWSEMVSSVNTIKSLTNDKSFSKRELASLVLSKIYFNLGDFQNSMNYALSSGSLFNVLSKSQYVETLLYKFIDEYIRLKNESVLEQPKIDERLELIVMGMFDRCFKEKSFRQALGIAIESKRLDIIEKSIVESDNITGMLNYSTLICNTLVTNRTFRQQVLGIIVKLYLSQEKPEYINVTQCLIFLDGHKEIADILLKLIKEDDSLLLAYQIGFDLFQNSTQQFLKNVRSHLPEYKTSSSNSNTSDPMEIDEIVADGFESRVKKLHTILRGDITISLNLEFLYRNCNVDMHVLQSMKSTSENHKGNIFYAGTLFANAIMHAGTTRDTFLRGNLEWLMKTTHWNKFSAIASLGVINKGHIKESKTLLKTYLPAGDSVNAHPYSESGALYALGLIHAGHGEEIIEYLQKYLRNPNTTLQHGAALGLGLAAMATGNELIYDELRDILFTDDSISGEACGFAMGLVMLGTGNQRAIDEMLAYAHETQKEKIIRSLSMGIALLMYGKEESADVLIEQLLTDKDPLLRYGGMYTIAFAYCGTGNNDALRKLLHFAVSDGSDSVRRAAVTCIGFILSRQPEKCPKTVSLLAESYNPHVRYGACIALGIACAASGNRDALDILKKLTSDSVGFVKQAAWIALAMVLIQTSKEQLAEVETVRKQFATCINDKREDTMSKFGAILAYGIIDAGGRNCTIQLHSPSGHKNMSTIVGIATFLQFWYWFPMTHFMGLALTPTYVIGLNKNLEMPVFHFKSNSKPSLFAYPPETKPVANNQVSKIETAVLSYSRKLRSSTASTNQMDVDKKEDLKKKKEEEEKKKKEEEEAKEQKPQEPEPLFEKKLNPARVVPKQLQYVVFDDPRYQPIKKTPVLGVVLLRDNSPNEPEQLVVKEKPETVTPPPVSNGQQSGTAINNNKKEELPEPQAPQPFEFTD